MNVKEITTQQWAAMSHEQANEILAPLPLVERIDALTKTPSSMVPYEYWIRKSKAELMQCYMNAITTQSCLGHSKAERNEQAANHYLQLMIEYNIPIPPKEICYILGEFNGYGSK